MQYHWRFFSILFMLFALPPLSAWWYYQHPTWQNWSHLNNGHLLSPPIKIQALAKPNSWQVLYVAKNGCDKVCLNNVEQLAKVRLALGRHMVGLSMSVLSSSPLQTQMLSRLREMDVNWMNLDTRWKMMLQEPIWIIDSSGWLVMSYPSETKPQAIYEDLKRLSPLWEQ